MPFYENYAAYTLDDPMLCRDCESIAITKIGDYVFCADHALILQGTAIPGMKVPRLA